MQFLPKVLINHSKYAKILSEITFLRNRSVNIKEVSTEALAYLGDSVLEIRVREKLVRDGISGSGNLNRASLFFVKASEQAAAMHRITGILSEEETLVFKRGRNMSGGNVPRSATMSEYRTATGMEVLFGYLHLLGRHERIDELFNMAYPQATDQNN